MGTGACFAHPKPAAVGPDEAGALQPSLSGEGEMHKDRGSVEGIKSVPDLLLKLILTCRAELFRLGSGTAKGYIAVASGIARVQQHTITQPTCALSVQEQCLI